MIFHVRAYWVTIADETLQLHAAMRADAMLDMGDLGGYAVWKRILRAVEEFQGTEPGPGVAVH